MKTDHGAEAFSSLSARSERRQFARFNLDAIGVTFDTASGESRGVLLNLCEGGMAVHSVAQVALGSVKRLRWELPQPAEPPASQGATFRLDKATGGYKVEFPNPSPAPEPVEAEGVVVWIDKQNPRFGIKFQNLPQQVEQSIFAWALHQVLAASEAARPGSLPVEPLRKAIPASPGRRRIGSGSVAPNGAAMVLSGHGRIGQLPPPAISSQPRPGRRPPWASVAAIVAFVSLIVFGLGAYWGGHAANPGDPAFAGGAGSAPMLRLAGSNTIGATLAPALAQAFLKQLGAKDIRVLPGAKADELSVQALLPGFLPGGSSRVEIQIAAHGSATAFDELIDASCDIGMASRKVKPREITRLASLGDLSSPASEHLLALDGIAVIVHASNPLSMLTKDQLAAIFSGAVSDWSQLGRQRGSIHVYSPDNNSGTYDTFKTLILGNKPLLGTAKRLEDSRALSDAVAADPNAIGFIGLPYIVNAKAIAVAERGAIPFQPNRLTVGTEDYLLSRRLYLYTPANPRNRYVQKFVEFALSKAGQEVVGDVGFIAQNVTAVQDVVPVAAPYQYRRLTQSAGRLSLDFRFVPGLTTLDSKATMDLDRVISFLADSGYSGDNVMLLGFTDNTGNRPANLAMSQSRARAVAEAFAQRGLKPATVKGFGPDLPVASNESESGRERNRRVEIWLKEPQCTAPRTAHDSGPTTQVNDPG